MTIEELFSVQEDLNKLKSLSLELDRIEGFNPYKNNVITDMPRGGEAKDMNLWYVAEKERIEKEIVYYQQKLQRDRKKVKEYIESLPHPENDIVRFRVINDISWEEIGDLVGYSGRGAAKRFYKTVKCSESS